jgi:hypothetical protein
LWRRSGIELPVRDEFLAQTDRPGQSGRGGPASAPLIPATSVLNTPADFGKFIAAETEKWGKVIGQ